MPAEPASEPEPTSTPHLRRTTSCGCSYIHSCPRLTLEVERLSHLGMELLTKFTKDHSPARKRLGRRTRRCGVHRRVSGRSRLPGQSSRPVEVDYIAWSEDFVSLIGDDMPDLRAVPMAMTGLGDVGAPLVSVSRAFEEDIPDGGLEGVIAAHRTGRNYFRGESQPGLLMREHWERLSTTTSGTTSAVRCKPKDPFRGSILYLASKVRKCCDCLKTNPGWRYASR